MQNREWIIFAIAIMVLIFPVSSCQESRHKIMFYNVENLFDTIDDSLTADQDFTPSGYLHWTQKRYYDKLNKIYKVIIAAGEWHPPLIIGLCEIENRRVLNDLTGHTPLSKFHYGIIHKDSPDERGIDVALLYDIDRVRVEGYSFITIGHFDVKTRDILYAKTIINDDTCHIFVNHWPSRSAGQLETDQLRMMAARILRQSVDSLFSNNLYSKIIILGDFNDDPSDDSIMKGLLAQQQKGRYLPDGLFNLSVPQDGAVNGTLKYQGNWNIFDQIIVSGDLLTDTAGLHVKTDGYMIFYNSFMLEKDETYNGVKPFRTYLGFRYLGGFSDHLPVVVDIY